MMIKYYNAEGWLVWFGTEEELTAEVLNAATEDGWTREIPEET